MSGVLENTTVPIVLDIEASGFGRGSYPIEVGFAMPDGHTRCSLIKPEAEWTHWDDSSEALHGISRKVLAEYGKPIGDIANWLNHNLRGLTVYSDAWGNDLTWLSTLYEYAEVPQLFHLEALNTLLSEQQMNLWAETRKMITSELNIQRHRASNDAKIIQMTYLATLYETSNDASGAHGEGWGYQQLNRFGIK